MPKYTVTLADLPDAQFTAGSLLKTAPAGTKLADVRTALDALVTSGDLTMTKAKSGAVNFKKAKTSGRRAATPPAADGVSALAADQGERIKRAKAEAAALKAWEKLPKAQQGPRPSTVNLDALNPNTKAGKTGRGKASDSTPRGTTVQFVVDGKPMAASQNKLSSVAWAHTKGIGGETVARISVTDLRALFAKADVADPSNTVGVNVTLPNGKVVTTTAL